MLATSKQEGMLEKIGKLKISTQIIIPYLKNPQQKKRIMEVNRKYQMILNLYNNSQMINKKTQMICKSKNMKKKRRKMKKTKIIKNSYIRDLQKALILVKEADYFQD